MPRVSKEQIDYAKSIDLLAYLKSNEPHNIIKQGADRYILRDHDSFVISNKKWCWNSRGYGCKTATALTYLIDVRGMDFLDAVHLLNNGSIQKLYVPEYAVSTPKKNFTLPIANKNNDRVISYLRGRGIDKEIINKCIKNGSLYQSAKSYNCIFVGFDGTIPKFACERGISDDYKKDVYGSDKKYSFCLPPLTKGCKQIALMEAPVDILAHATIHKMNGNKWGGYRLSLGGVSSIALISFLERHNEITRIELCLDADKAGKDATARITGELLTDKRFSHIKIVNTPPPLGKDYADTLTTILQMNKEKSHESRQQAVNFI